MNIRTASQQLDKHFDDMLYDGMSIEEAAEVEQRRALAQKSLADKLVSRATADGPPHRETFGPLDDPIRRIW